jgi:hypothetical protein
LVADDVFFMHHSLSSATGSTQDTEETEEPVLVEALEFSADEEEEYEYEYDNFAQLHEEDHLDFLYDDFEDDDDEMSLVRVGLHDLNTLRHLYRFGILQTKNRPLPLLASHADR